MRLTIAFFMMSLFSVAAFGHEPRERELIENAWIADQLNEWTTAKHKAISETLKNKDDASYWSDLQERKAFDDIKAYPVTDVLVILSGDQVINIKRTTGDQIYVGKKAISGISVKNLKQSLEKGKAGDDELRWAFLYALLGKAYKTCGSGGSSEACYEFGKAQSRTEAAATMNELMGKIGIKKVSCGKQSRVKYLDENDKGYEIACHTAYGKCFVPGNGDLGKADDGKNLIEKYDLMFAAIQQCCGYPRCQKQFLKPSAKAEAPADDAESK